MPTADQRIYPVAPLIKLMLACAVIMIAHGMNKEAATGRFTGRDNSRLSVALGAVTLCGLLVEADDAGMAQTVRLLRRGGELTPA